MNARGTLNLLEEARRRGIRRFVYTSSSEVYGNASRVPMDENHPTFPHTVYGGSKLAAEAYVRAYHRTYGLPSVVLRPFNFDTLAVIAYQMAADERLGEAALPSLTLVLVGVLPVILLSRAIGRTSRPGG